MLCPVVVQPGRLGAALLTVIAATVIAAITDSRAIRN